MAMAVKVVAWRRVDNTRHEQINGPKRRCIQRNKKS